MPTGDWVWSGCFFIIMNNTLWNEILSNLCEQTHSQFGIFALARAAMVIVNKEIWRVFLEVWGNILKKIDQNRKWKEIEQAKALQEKQVSAVDQVKGLVNTKFLATWNKLPKEVQLAL